MKFVIQSDDLTAWPVVISSISLPRAVHPALLIYQLANRAGGDWNAAAGSLAVSVTEPRRIR